jgi:transposase
VFLRDYTATDIAELTKISRISINIIFKKIRLGISKICLENDIEKGKFEVDESYFGPRRIRGKEGTIPVKKSLFWVY